MVIFSLTYTSACYYSLSSLPSFFFICCLLSGVCGLCCVIWATVCYCALFAASSPLVEFFRQSSAIQADLRPSFLFCVISWTTVRFGVSLCAFPRGFRRFFEFRRSRPLLMSFHPQFRFPPFPIFRTSADPHKDPVPRFSRAYPFCRLSFLGLGRCRSDSPVLPPDGTTVLNWNVFFLMSYDGSFSPAFS